MAMQPLVSVGKDWENTRESSLLTIIATIKQMVNPAKLPFRYMKKIMTVAAT